MSIGDFCRNYLEGKELMDCIALAPNTHTHTRKEGG
jgi:hypothetical protein